MLQVLRCVSIGVNKVSATTDLIQRALQSDIEVDLMGSQASAVLASSIDIIKQTEMIVSLSSDSSSSGKDDDDAVDVDDSLQKPPSDNTHNGGISVLDHGQYLDD